MSYNQRVQGYIHRITRSRVDLSVYAIIQLAAMCIQYEDRAYSANDINNYLLTKGVQ
jgi:hypothetical protein